MVKLISCQFYQITLKSKHALYNKVDKYKSFSFTLSSPHPCKGKDSMEIRDQFRQGERALMADTDN